MKFLVLFLFISVYLNASITDEVKKLDRKDKCIEAVALYKKACEQNIGKACFSVAFIYSHPKCEIQNTSLEKQYATKAIRLLKNECENKNGEACENLGFMYYSGIGVKKNKDLFLEYYNQACDLGVKSACDFLDEQVSPKAILMTIIILILSLISSFPKRNQIINDAVEDKRFKSGWKDNILPEYGDKRTFSFFRFIFFSIFYMILLLYIFAR